MNLKKFGKVFTSKFVGTGPSSYEKRIYRATVSQRLRNTDLQCHSLSAVNPVPSCLTPGFYSLLFFLRFSVLYNKFKFNTQTVLTYIVIY